ncbi:MAG: hypothetical protein HY695_01255 [Deltaproteobacteria bacterium]|nr:hypothetical protein [Deltaproteobacteria bacterium]
MRWYNRAIFAAVLPVSLIASGCEGISLVQRRDIDERSVDRSRIERERDYGSYDRYSSRDELVGTVQRVDEYNRTILIRTTEGRLMAVRYDPGTIVLNRDREMRIDSLRAGDYVIVQVRRDVRGEEFAHTIRLTDSLELGRRY